MSVLTINNLIKLIMLQCGGIGDVIKFSTMNKRIRQVYNSNRSFLLLQFVNFETRVKIDLSGDYIDHIPFKFASAEKTFMLACENNLIGAVSEMIDHDVNISAGFSIACCSNNYNTAKLLIEHMKFSTNPVNFINEMNCALLLTKNYDIVKLLIENGANNLNKTLFDACVYVDTDINTIKLLASGADNLNDVLPVACNNGNIAAAEVLIDNGADNLDEMLEFVCKKGYYEMAKLLVDNGATNYNIALYHACEYEYLDIIRLLIIYGATNLNDEFIYACRTNRCNVAEIFIECGLNNLNSGLLIACKHGAIDIVELLVKNNVDNIFEGIKYAKLAGHNNIVEFLKAL